MPGTNNANIGTGSGGVGTSTTTVSVVANYDQQASTIFDVELFNRFSPAQLQTLTLATGANTINATLCPALPQCGGVILIPPNTNTNTITVKGISADTGLAISPSTPTMFTFASVPPTSFVLTTSSSISGFRFAWL